MSDADRRWAYGPLQSQAPDPWHDRRRDWTPPAWFSVLLIGVAITFGVLS